MKKLAMNSLYKNHVLSKKIVLQCSHVMWRILIGTCTFFHFFFTCYKCFIARKIGSVATGKVKTFTDTILALFEFLAKIEHVNVVAKSP